MKKNSSKPQNWKKKKNPAKTPIHPFVLCLQGKCFFNVFCVSLMFFWESFYIIGLMEHGQIVEESSVVGI
jgi:hypothetical protein